MLTHADIDKLEGRDLDAAVVEHLLGWTLVDVGPDAGGENACQILAPPGGIPKDFGDLLPRRGLIHKAWLTQPYHRDLAEAILLCQRFGGNLTISIEGPIAEMPTRITREVLKTRIPRVPEPTST